MNTKKKNKKTIILVIAVIFLLTSALIIFINTQRPHNSGEIVAISSRDSANYILYENGTVWRWETEFPSWSFDSDDHLYGTPTLTRVAGLRNIIAIESGTNHTIALRNDGTVWMWQFFENPMQVENLENITEISAHRAANYALSKDGTVWNWSAAFFGDPPTVPRKVDGLYDIVGVVGRAFLKSDGTVWQQNSRGIEHIEGVYNINAISLGVLDYGAMQSHIVALRGDGTVWSWINVRPGESNYMGQLGDYFCFERFRRGNEYSYSDYNVPVQAYGLDGVVAVTSGYMHTAALRYDGTVWIWGRMLPNEMWGGYECALQDPERYPIKHRPVQLTELSDIVYIYAGSNHLFAVCSQGNVWAMGNNRFGRLGNGARSFIYQPTIVIQDRGRLVPPVGPAEVQQVELDPITVPFQGRRIGAGTAHRTFLCDEGIVWQWGTISTVNINLVSIITGGDITFDTRILYNRLSPTAITGIDNVVDLISANNRTVALRNDGTVWDFEIPPQPYRDSVGMTPTQVENIQNIVQVSSGGWHELALRSDGTVWAWGDNYNNKVDSSYHNNRFIPVEAHPGRIYNIVAVAAGHEHSVVLRQDGTVWSWGNNRSGQIGDGVGFLRTRRNPTQAYGVYDIIAISAGAETTLALRSDGTVWTWGRVCSSLLEYEQTRTHVPLQIPGLYNISTLPENGGNLVIDKNGYVWTWNENGVMQFEGLSDVVSIAGNCESGIALLGDGTVWTWGDNSGGQLGIGSRLDSEIPVQIILPE